MLIPASVSRLASGVTISLLSSRSTPNPATRCTPLHSAASSPHSLSSMPTSTLPDTASAFLSALPPLLPGRKRIYLLRHGQTDWNARGLMQGGGFDIPLNDNGLEQARCAAEALSGVNLDAVASSHLIRAVQTADVLHAFQSEARRDESLSSAAAPPSRVVMEEFGEMRFGVLEGNAIHGPEATDETRLRFSELNDAMAEDGHLTWPGEGAESTYEVEARARRGLEKFLRRFSGDDDDDGGCEMHLAVVAHGRHNKVLLASLLRGDATEFKSIKQGNTCINVIDWEADESLEGGGRAVEVVLNYVDHAEVGERHR